MLRPYVSGAAFGAALAAAGIYQPDVIVEQMGLQNWHMVTTFLTASGTSTLLVTIFQRLGYLKLSPRNYSTLNIFGSLDGNIIGGLLIGTGLAVSGSCPGTVFAQVGAGVRSGFFTLGGAMLGGVIWSGLLRPALRSREKPAPEASNIKARCLTIGELTGTSQTSALIAVEALFTGIVAALVYLASPKSSGLVGPVTGGFLVAGAQLVSILTRRSLIGTSGCFEEVGDFFLWAIGRGIRPKSYNAIVLTAGMATGALAVSLASPSTQKIPEITIEPARAVLGGVFLALGSRMAGGCTSGHGISGISLLSVSSFVTVAAMFAGGMAVGMIIG
ncbi:uncharacterized protein GGS22DRAFT_13547 [Annulohypoxylon maeteangense]|uniref:uncharacterized protein n=1 Tax=Annulohypoxylon maeteangense TaxID=1927788 RepID=UPI00200837F1|nr:uncharacterized protein GGS22DRAFT_13547 [Annulohypoxylon maeteangense]KAI0890430.1 hypothetical protein GGS22DRAFT_13547 [Annulohypoxylon maeteangense]